MSRPDPRCLAAALLLALAGPVGGADERPPGATPAASGVAARVGDRVITLGEVDRAWREADPAEHTRAMQVVYEERRSTLDRLIGELLIEEAAKREGVPAGEYASRETAKRLKPVAAGGARAFYDDNRARMPGKTFEEMRPTIEKFLEREQQAAARAVLIADLRRGGPPVRVSIEPPRYDVAVAASDPARGGPAAAVLVVEFSDYQCPYCAGVVPTLAKLRAAYGDRLRFVWKDFPLTSVHPEAFKASEAAHCAGEQGKYWEFHDRLFAGQRALDGDALKKSAAALGLDAAAFAACLDSGKYASRVRAGLEEGNRLGVASTPSVFINGRLVMGAQPYERFQAIVEEELENGQVGLAAPAIDAGDARLQYWGRWDLRGAAATGAVTVNTGSTLVARFRGTDLTLHFAVAQYPQRFPTLWVQVDDGPWRVATVAEELRVAPGVLDAGEHVARVVVKGLNEWLRRWESPLESSVVLRGVTPAPGGELLMPPPRPARRVEYFGDSITEGVLVLYDGPRLGWDRARWPDYSDGRRSWAYESARLAGAEPSVVGFGRHGLTIHGNGGVPPAFHSLPFVYAGAPSDKSRPPDAVVVNLGTNDRKAPAEMFAALYRAYLGALRQEYPRARIVCLAPFNGTHRDAIAASVAARRSDGDGGVEFVDTAGWIDPARHTTDGVHLNLAGNRVAAEKVAAVLRPLLAAAR